MDPVLDRDDGCVAAARAGATSGRPAPADWIRRNLFRSPARHRHVAGRRRGRRLRALPPRPLRVRHRALGDRPRQPQAVHGRALPARRPVAGQPSWWSSSRSYGGLVAGFVAVRRSRLASTPPAAGCRGGDASSTSLGRLWPLVGGTLLLLSLSTTTGPGCWLGATSPPRSSGASSAGTCRRAVGCGRSCSSASSVRRRSSLFLPRALGWDEWGGLMLNVFLAFTGIVLCFPLGVALALGPALEAARSSAWLSVVYIELFRGVPLFVLLLLVEHRPRLLLAGRRRTTPGFVVRADRRARRCSPRRTSPRSCAAGCSRCPAGRPRPPPALGLGHRCARRS